MAHSHPDPLKLTHQCEVLGQMLISAQRWGNDMQTCACLKLILEQLKKTMGPLEFSVPARTGEIYPEYAEHELKERLDRLQRKLENNDSSELESLWNICCEALELLDQCLYQQERGLSEGRVVGVDDLGCTKICT